MPSPGIASIQTELESGTYLAGGFTISIATGSLMGTKLATGMHNGWDSARDNTPTSDMEGSIWSAFGGYVVDNATYGRDWIKALGKGIDLEMADWAASFVIIPKTHSYHPTASTIKNRILGLVSPDYPGFAYLADKVSNIYATNATEISP